MAFGAVAVSEITSLKKKNPDPLFFKRQDCKLSLAGNIKKERIGATSLVPSLRSSLIAFLLLDMHGIYTLSPLGCSSPLLCLLLLLRFPQLLQCVRVGAVGAVDLRRGAGGALVKNSNSN